jgi:ankyrin repeat protein
MDVLRAAAEGDVETVKQWLTATSQNTRHPELVMHVSVRAAKHGHDNICQLMLDSGAMVEYAVSVALYAACSNNQQSTAQLLVRHGHINTHDLAEALLRACVNGHMCIVTWLTSDVMQLSQSDRIKWMLFTASARGNMSDIKQLVTQVDSDATHVMSQALRVACLCGRDDVVKWLTSHTIADVSNRGVVQKYDGEVTSLMVACDMGHNIIVRRLLQCVTPHTVNMLSGSVANTALHFAICFETDETCRMQNACANNDINAVTATLFLGHLDLQVYYGYTALYWACMRGYVEIVRMLLSAFADTRITNDWRRTPAMMAKMCNHPEVLSYLRCTLSDPPGIAAHVSNSNNNSVSISMSSIEDVMQQNISHKNSSRPGSTNN